MESGKRRRQLLDKFFEQFIDAGMEIRAWVVLPNHYHLLVDMTDFDLLGRPTWFMVKHLTNGMWKIARQDEGFGTGIRTAQFGLKPITTPP